MITEGELKAIIKKKRGGKWLEYHGPTKIGTADVYEVWTTTTNPSGRFWLEKEDGQKVKVSPQTRFVIENENGSKLYFDYFADLAAHFLNKETEAFKLKKFSLNVAAFVLIAALGTVSYLLITGKGTSEVLVLALAGAVASGGYLFFGRWLLPGTSDGTPTQP
jgi:hypothetical protein